MRKRGAIYAAASLIQMAGTALAIPFLTRLLTPQEFGSVVTALIVVQMTWIVASLGIPAAVTRQYLRAEEGGPQARRLIGASFVSAVATSILFLATSGLWGPPFGFAALERGVVLSIATGGILAVVNSCQALQRAQGAAGRFAVSVALSAGLGNVLGVGLCALQSRPSHSTFLLGMLIGAVSALAWGVWKASPKPFVRSDWPTISRIALPTLPHMLGIYLVTSIDRVVISSEFGSAAVARYQVAYFVGSVTLLALQALNNAWAPSVIAAPDHTRSAQLHRTTRQLSALVAAGVVTTIVLAPWGLKVAAPDAYQSDELIIVTSLIAFCSFPALVYLAHSHVLYVHGRMGAFAYASPLSLVVGIGVAAAMSSYGLVGVASAPLAAQVVLATLIRRAALRCEDEARLALRVVPAAAVALVVGSAALAGHVFLY